MVLHLLIEEKRMSMIISNFKAICPQVTVKSLKSVRVSGNPAYCRLCSCFSYSGSACSLCSNIPWYTYNSRLPPEYFSSSKDGPDYHTRWTNTALTSILVRSGGTFWNPATSCSDISLGSPSGDYWIQTNGTSNPAQVYCM